MSQNIDLNSPTAASALHIADSLLRESCPISPVSGDFASQAKQLEERVQQVGFLAHALLMSFVLAIDESNLRRMKNRLKNQET